MTPDTRHYLVARFVPGQPGPSFRSSLGRLRHTLNSVDDVWEGCVLVVTPQGRERIIKLRIAWKGVELTVRSRVEGLGGQTISQIVTPLQATLVPGIVFSTDAMDFFGEGVNVRVEVQEPGGD